MFSKSFHGRNTRQDIRIAFNSEKNLSRQLTTATYILELNIIFPLADYSDKSGKFKLQIKNQVFYILFLYHHSSYCNTEPNASLLYHAQLRYQLISLILIALIPLISAKYHLPTLHNIKSLSVPPIKTKQKSKPL